MNVFERYRPRPQPSTLFCAVLSLFIVTLAYKQHMHADPAPPLPVINLKIQRRSAHPWVFQKMVEKPATRLPPGSVVDVHDRDGTWVGRGFYNGHSRITLRILTADPGEPIDDAFF